MRAIRAACCALITIAASTGTAFGQQAKLLGEEIADFERETDTFVIADRRQRFDGIEISVERGTIRLYSLTITFGNGRTREVEADEALKPSDRPFTVRFGSQGRRIEKVEATYRTLRRRSPKRAIVALQGTVAEPVRDNSTNEFRKAVTADLRDGRAAIELSQYSGPVRSVQVEVGLRDVFVRHITVTFANGDLKKFNLNRWIDEGRKTPRLTFEGRARRVRQVVVVTRPSQSRDIARFVLHTKWADDDANRRDERGRDERVERNDRSEIVVHGDRFGPVPRLDRGGAPRNHILLGTLNIVLGKPSLELAVNRGIGPIASLALRAGRSDVGIGAITAVYANGERDGVQVLRQLRSNRVSPKILLKRSGKLRSIRIKATALTTQSSRLRVYAMLDQDAEKRPRRAAPAPGKWINLAITRPPRFSPKTDVITVGRGKGRLESFRLRVEKHDVRFKGIRIIFGNGSEQEFPFYAKVNDGLVTNPFVLAKEGRGRYVEKIIVRYNTTANFKGRALVAFEGFRR